jgi:ribose/xylose/arabinose/galactoside ABC-type transport system permease subunit/putative methionine-R-sulfoxide reductase with GAF domain
MKAGPAIGKGIFRRRTGGRIFPSGWQTDQIGALIGLLVLLVTFSALSPAFRQVGNLLLIATMASTIGIVAVGQTLVLLTGGIDLSVSSVVALSGMIAASLMKYGLGPIPALTGPLSWLAILFGLLVGTLIGAAQGWLIANRRMPPFIVTLGTMVGLHGVSQAIAYGWPTHSLPDDFKWISDGYVWIIPVPAMIMFAVFLAAWYILRNTKFGRYCYAIGGNETAARLSGVKVDRHKMLVYAACGLLAGLAGMILIAYIDGAATTNGGSYELYSIAASIIGGVSLGGGVGGVWGTFIGVLIITVIPNGMIMLNALPWWKDAITGAIIVLAVLVDVERRRARQAVSKPEVSASILSGRYLNEMLTRLAQTVEERVGFAYCRIYLADRDTGELVPQTPPCNDPSAAVPERRAHTGRGNILQEAKETRRPVYVPDIGRRAGVIPMGMDSQCAVALPLIQNKRLVGVLEVQSPVPDAFREEAIGILEEVAAANAPMLEDAWLLESGWLMRQTRDALRHMWDDHYLGRCELGEWAILAGGGSSDPALPNRGEELRHILLTAIDGLRPPAPDSRDFSRSKRGYRILQLTYVEERQVDSIARELHMSRRQYFYDLKGAIEALVDNLVRSHHPVR